MTCGGDAARSTMLTLSDRWFTTQISVLVRAATETGSMPTGTDSKVECEFCFWRSEGRFPNRQTSRGAILEYFEAMSGNVFGEGSR